MLLARHHFLIQANGRVIAYHVFGGKIAPPASSQALSMSPAPVVMMASASSTLTPKTPTKVARLNKSSARKKSSKAGTTVAHFAATPQVEAASNLVAPVTALGQYGKLHLSKSFDQLTDQYISLTTRKTYSSLSCQCQANAGRLAN